MESNSQKELKNLFELIYMGDVKGANKKLENNPKLALVRSDIQDGAHRKFKNVTVLMYAIWSLDRPMCDIIVKHMDIEEIKLQLDVFEKRTDVGRFDFGPLLKAYRDIMNNSTNSVSDCNNLFFALANQQALVPAWFKYAFSVIKKMFIFNMPGEKDRNIEYAKNWTKGESVVHREPTYKEDFHTTRIYKSLALGRINNFYAGFSCQQKINENNKNLQTQKKSKRKIF